MNVAIIRFLGTNCEYDAEYAYKLLGANTTVVWHKEESLPANTDLVVLPGGFSYGDYLRSGAIARFSPIMKSVMEHAGRGGYVLGICNGFQILLECGLLEGAMKHNESLHFVSKWSELEVLDKNNKFLHLVETNTLNIPIAHGEGNYYTDSDTLKRMYENGQVLLKYKNNPNGSLENIAGICNKTKNVFGLMPHPERAVTKEIGSVDGILMLKGFFS